jgi:two-component system, cell cycle sensor histidine kinase and response regulator CckA
MNDRAAEPETSAAGHRARVLVIDDDDSVRSILHLLLDHLTIDALLADSGGAAEALLVSSPGELRCILLDSLMPGVDGPRTLATVRRLAPATPVVVMSGNLAPDAADEFRRLGVRVFLQKPFGLQELAAALAAATE